MGSSLGSFATLCYIPHCNHCWCRLYSLGNLSLSLLTLSLFSLHATVVLCYYSSILMHLP